MISRWTPYEPLRAIDYCAIGSPSSNYTILTIHLHLYVKQLLSFGQNSVFKVAIFELKMAALGATKD